MSFNGGAADFAEARTHQRVGPQAHVDATAFAISTHINQQIPAGLVEAIETYRFRPRYAGANLGHPSHSYWFCYAVEMENAPP